jgi:hypothetical protein
MKIIMLKNYCSALALPLCRSITGHAQMMLKLYLPMQWCGVHVVKD